jgi:hypothetical protein
MNACEWHLRVTGGQIGFWRDSHPFGPKNTGAFLKLRGRWVECHRWEARARALGVSETLIGLAKASRDRG